MKTFFVAPCLVLSAALSVAAQAQTSSDALSLRCADFQRNTNGSWVTQRQTLVPYPNGIVTFAPNFVVPPADHTYMGLRLGQMLDERCRTPGRQ